MKILGNILVFVMAFVSTLYGAFAIHTAWTLMLLPYGYPVPPYKLVIGGMLISQTLAAPLLTMVITRAPHTTIGEKTWVIIGLNLFGYTITILSAYIWSFILG